MALVAEQKGDILASVDGCDVLRKPVRLPLAIHLMQAAF